jgi:hypothetical protein
MWYPVVLVLLWLAVFCIAKVLTKITFPACSSLNHIFMVREIGYIENTIMVRAIGYIENTSSLYYWIVCTSSLIWSMLA